MEHLQRFEGVIFRGRGNLVVNLDRLNQKQVQEK
jgi:hypothetical protein